MHPDGRVTFRYANRRARSVMLKGAFNDWEPLIMPKGRKGRFELTVGPLPAGTYVYRFLVDGRKLPDPANGRRNRRKGTIESIVDVKGGDYYVPPRRADSPPYAGRRDPKRFVVVSLNTHSFQERTGRFAKLAAMAEGLAALGTDVAGLNEIVYGKLFSRGYRGAYYDSAAILRDHLEALTGDRFHLHRKAFARWADGEAVANAILSRHPLEDPDAVELTTESFWPAPYSKRQCIAARVRLPDGEALDVFVTHTMGYRSPDTPHQIKEVKSFVASRQRKDDLGALVMGDFNVPHTDKEYYGMLVAWRPDFVDVFALANRGAPADVTTAPDQASRIDYVFWVSGRMRLSRESATSAIVFTGDAYDGRVYPRVSDHYGVVASIALPREGESDRLTSP